MDASWSADFWVLLLTMATGAGLGVTVAVILAHPRRELAAPPASEHVYGVQPPVEHAAVPKPDHEADPVAGVGVALGALLLVALLGAALSSSRREDRDR